MVSTIVKNNFYKNPVMKNIFIIIYKTKIFIRPLFNQMFLKAKNKDVTLSKVRYKTSCVTSKNLFSRSSTLLNVNDSIAHIQKRYYSGTSIINNITKTFTPQMLLEQKNLIRNKAIFSRFCEHFQKYTLAQLQDDKTFMQHMHDNIHNEPTLFSRAYQLALEVTYFKRRFSEETLQQLYKNDFKLNDMYNINQGVCDQSTIYTCTLAKKITKYFNLASDDLVVNSTPLFLTREKITQKMRQSMNYHKEMTENSCPDLTLKERPYDFKEPKDISFGKNHIYFIDKEYLTQKGFKIFQRLENSLENSLKNSQMNLSKEAQSFTKLIIKNLQNERQIQTCYQTRLDNLNLFLTKSDIPKDFKLPIFVPTKKFEIDISDVEQSTLDRIPLEKGFLDSVKAKKAIMGVLDTFDPSTKNVIEVATNGSIQFNIPKLEDLD